MNLSTESAPSPEGLSSTSTPAATFAIGQRLAGCYLLRALKTEGQNFTVWAAFDEVLGKDISLHLIPATVRADESSMEKLRHETKRNRQLVHPNVLRVYDFAEESDWAGVVMASFEGESLASLLGKRASGFFEPAEIKSWLFQLCQTLEETHKIQLVHGDISPENVVIERDGRVLLANFGISRCIRAARARAAGKMPAELQGPASTTTDIAGLGALVHHLLVGQPPAHEEAQTLAEHRLQLKRTGGPIPPVWEQVVAASVGTSGATQVRSAGEFASLLGLEKTSTAPVEAPVDARTGNTQISSTSTPAPKPVPIELATTPALSVLPQPEAAPAEKTAHVLPEPEPDPSEENAVPDYHPTMPTRRSGVPATVVAAGVVLAGLGAYALWSGDFLNSESAPNDAAISADHGADGSEWTAVTNPIKTRTPVESPASPETEVPRVEVAVATPAPAPPTAVHPAPPKTSETVTLAAAKPKATPAPAATPAATATSAVRVPTAVPSNGKGEPTLAAKVAEFEAAKKAMAAAEKAEADAQKQKEQADVALATATKLLEDKSRTALPVLKAAEEIAARKQQRDEEMRTAALAAQEAQKLAAEKVRAAEEARKAANAVESESKDKLTAQQKAEAELAELKKAATAKEKQAADLAAVAEEAASKRAQQLTVLKKSEQEMLIAKATADKAAEEAAQKAAEDAARMEIARKAAAERTEKIRKEMDDAKRAFDERMRALEESLKATENPLSTPPPPSSKTDAAPNIEAPPSAKVTAPPATPTPTALPPALPPADATLMAKAVIPKPLPPPKLDSKSNSTSAVPAALTNTLGMKFVSVGDVQFSIWLTRVQDFETFANATGLKSTVWRDPGFKQGPDHPVVNVTWLEAMAFCKWLTFKEQREGALSSEQFYRLPTDVEWSKAVGLPEETGKTPEARDMGVPDVYPWGTQWPPPANSGNYTGEETGSDVAIKGFDDGYPATAPVGSFAANNFGLYDMGGNVWQWVMDAWSTDPKSKVLRGASWYNGALKLSLLSSCRVHASNDSSTDNYGFRCVIASETAKSAKK